MKKKDGENRCMTALKLQRQGSLGGCTTTNELLPTYLFIYLQYLFITYLFLFQETVSISSLEFETALYPLILESSGAHAPQYRTRQYDINN